MNPELPRSILPFNGIPKSRIGVDFRAPKDPIWGQPAGLPNFFGKVLLTDNFEHLILTQDGRQVLCHVQHFEVLKQERVTKPKTSKEPRETGVRQKRLDVLLAEFV